MPWTNETVAERGLYAMRHVTTHNPFPGAHELEEGYEIPSWMERGTEVGVDPDTGDAIEGELSEAPSVVISDEADGLTDENFYRPAPKKKKPKAKSKAKALDATDAKGGEIVDDDPFGDLEA